MFPHFRDVEQADNLRAKSAAKRDRLPPFIPNLRCKRTDERQPAANENAR